MLGKAIQAMSVWVVLLVMLRFAWPPSLWFPQIWLLVTISTLVNVLQPSYRVLEGSRTPQDVGTAAQIVWTVYLSQIAALAELVVRRRETLPMDVASWLALAGMVGGLVLRSWAVFSLGPFFSWNVEVRPGQTIVRSGPYRFVRHPSYTGAYMTFVASCFLLHSWVAGILASFALALAFLRRTRHEEQLLRVTFPEYDEYSSRTAAFVPGVF